MEKKKLNIEDLKVQSFVTELSKDNDGTNALQGGFTGDCLSFVRITCPDCDFQSIPLDECNWTPPRTTTPLP